MYLAVSMMDYKHSLITRGTMEGGNGNWSARKEDVGGILAAQDIELYWPLMDINSSTIP